MSTGLDHLAETMTRLRSLVASVTRATPMFRGKGRLILALESLLSRSDDHGSFVVLGDINGIARMYFDLRPWGQKFAYYYGSWERNYIEICRMLYRGGAFIDIGSSIGLYVICIGDLVRRAGALIASIEPIEANLQRQRRNVAINNLEDVVRYYQVALGDHDSEVTIQVDPEGLDNNAWVSNSGGTRVRVTTLDSLVETNGIREVGFIKMDIEGYEPMALKGAMETLRRDKPIILAEFNRERMKINGFDIGPSWEFLACEGYVAYRVEEDRLCKLDSPDDIENIFFVPRHFDLPASLTS